MATNFQGIVSFPIIAHPLKNNKAEPRVVENFEVTLWPIFSNC
jgi:hypothetical protein